MRGSKGPRHHQRELVAPERAAVRADPLRHDHVRARIAQRDRPAGRVVEEEGLQRAGDEVRARNRMRQHARRSVTRARRGAEDGTVDVRSPVANASSPPAETPNTAVRSAGSATPNRELAHRRTSSTKNFSWAANRSG